LPGRMRLRVEKGD
jgi:hypothetical protein